MAVHRSIINGRLEIFKMLIDLPSLQVLLSRIFPSFRFAKLDKILNRRVFQVSKVVLSLSKPERLISWIAMFDSTRVLTLNHHPPLCHLANRSQ